MLTFAQFIAENLDIDLLNEAKTVRKDDPNTVGQVTNNTKGPLHEIAALHDHETRHFFVEAQSTQAHPARRARA